MKLKLSYILGLISSAAVVSCYPPPLPNTTIPAPGTTDEVKPTDATRGVEDPTDKTLSDRARRDLYISQGKDPETGLPIIKDNTTPVPTDRPSRVVGNTPKSNTGPKTIEPTLPTPPVSQPPKKPQPTSYPYATQVPGRQGFVFNPYTNAKVDVRGLPSGTLVSDPRNNNQKFYVP